VSQVPQVSKAPEAQVISVQPGHATVRVESAAACARCAEGRGCGAAMSFGHRALRDIDVVVPAGLTLHVGERVRLNLAPARILHAAWLVYGMPLAGMVLAVAVGAFVAAPAGAIAGAVAGDLTIAVFASGGLAGGFLWGRRCLRRTACWRQFIPSVLARDDEPGTTVPWPG
jgi:sigma-E factor negative regulatory protein RseC